MSVREKLTVNRPFTWENCTESDFFPRETGNKEFDEALAAAGYAYDPLQDIFYSIMYPWQRNYGFCRLYDESAAPMGMIIDCEPIYFEFDRKKWLIELWKGQYDYVTGGEIGIYTDPIELDITDIFNGLFYNSASDEDRLQMSYILKKKGNTLFSRKELHWWLTGFKLGEFSEPWELSMDINITLKNVPMRNAFVEGLRNAGYSNKEFTIHGRTVSLTFDKPHTAQPITRTPFTDWIVQRKNEMVCNAYQDITKTCKTIQEIIDTIKKQAPDIYESITNIGKTRQFYAAYDKIKDFLNLDEFGRAIPVKTTGLNGR